MTAAERVTEESETVPPAYNMGDTEGVRGFSSVARRPGSPGNTEAVMEAQKVRASRQETPVPRHHLSSIAFFFLISQSFHLVCKYNFLLLLVTILLLQLRI